MRHLCRLIVEISRNLTGDICRLAHIRVVLGLTFLAAALMKVHELSTTPYLDKFPSRWAMIVFVEFEILFALWLFFVPKRLTQITWLAILGLFSFFACVTLYKALTGEASGGCFGRVEIYTLIFDAGIVTALLHWRPSSIALSTLVFSREFVLRAAVVILAWLSVGIPAAVAMGTYQPTVLAKDGVILGDDNLVIFRRTSAMIIGRVYKHEVSRCLTLVKPSYC